jgi:prepilin-type N-terminal cleavage/methylation domain-containing protein
MRHEQLNAGFTMVELMVVVLILGVLIMLAIPAFAGAKASALQKACYANQRTIEGAVQAYRAEHVSSPPASEVNNSHPLVTGGFVQNAPACPLAGPTGYYTIDSAGVVVGFPAACASAAFPAHGHFQ